MIQFTKPTNLNGAQLLDELTAGKVSIVEPPMLDDNGFFWLEIAEADKDKATIIVAAHNGTTVAPDKTAARQAILDRLGITEDEAKLLLA
jgi:hypothetical protein